MANQNDRPRFIRRGGRIIPIGRKKKKKKDKLKLPFELKTAAVLGPGGIVGDYAAGRYEFKATQQADKAARAKEAVANAMRQREYKYNKAANIRKFTRKKRGVYASQLSLGLPEMDFSEQHKIFKKYSKIEKGHLAKRAKYQFRRRGLKFAGVGLTSVFIGDYVDQKLRGESERRGSFKDSGSLLVSTAIGGSAGALNLKLYNLTAGGFGARKTFKHRKSYIRNLKKLSKVKITTIVKNKTKDLVKFATYKNLSKILGKIVK